MKQAARERAFNSEPNLVELGYSGLIESDLATSLLAIGIIKKVADLIITEWWDKWHSFFQEEIWLQQSSEGKKKENSVKK
ncbi:6430_t:CDS:2, partial [Gigaspora margarita]